MYDHKILKFNQPFYFDDTCDDYNKFQIELLSNLNAGYEIVHSEDISYNYYDTERSVKLFILRKPR